MKEIAAASVIIIADPVQTAITILLPPYPSINTNNCDIAAVYICLADFDGFQAELRF